MTAASGVEECSVHLDMDENRGMEEVKSQKENVKRIVSGWCAVPESG